MAMRLILAALFAMCAYGQIIQPGSGTGGGGGGVSDHGALTGLADNDHPRYIQGDCSAPSELTVATGAITVTAGGGCFDVDTESDAASDDLTTINCTAGNSFILKAESDARTVVLKATSFAVFGGVDQSLDQDGDYALGLCVATNTPIIWGFYDEAGAVRAASLEAAGSGITEFIEQTAPQEGTASGRHGFYFDDSSGRLYTHKNGGSALAINYNITHATDCTGVTVVGTGVSLLAGDQCHELDDDTNYVYDGLAWDAVGGGGLYPLLDVVFGRAQGAGSGFAADAAATEGLVLGSGVIFSGGSDWLSNGRPALDDTESFSVRGPVIPTGVGLTNLTIYIEASEFVAAVNNYVIDVSVTCTAPGEAAPTVPGTLIASVTLTSEGSTSLAREMVGSATGVNISTPCNVVEAPVWHFARNDGIGSGINIGRASVVAQ